MPTTETVYNGRDNTIDLLLMADGNPQDLSAVTRIVITERGGSFEVDSDLVPEAFDWETGSTGKLVLSFGHQGLVAGTFVCDLIVFDPSNSDGINWGRIVLKVVDS